MVEKSFQALILSLLIHGLLALVYYRLPEVKKAPDLTSVEVVYNNSPNGRIIIDKTNDLPDPTLEKLKTQVKNLSRIRRRVEREQVARPTNNPVVQNLADLKPVFTPQQSSGGAKARGARSQEASQELKLPGLNPALTGQSNTGFSKVVAVGGSTSGEWIPGVKEGNFTALNTDQFTYYTFFSRVGTAIRFRWVQGVRIFSDRASLDEIIALSRIPSSTNLEITINKMGDVLKVATLKTSGSAELDDAAIRAFWNASPLQNPPAEMAEDDGLIRLYYAFQVHWEPHYVAEGQ